MFLVSVFATWFGEGYCVRYRVVRVSTTIVFFTVFVIVLFRCVVVI